MQWVGGWVGAHGSNLYYLEIVFTSAKLHRCAFDDLLIFG
jgi:hypothetical protein